MKRKEFRVTSKGQLYKTKTTLREKESPALTRLLNHLSANILVPLSALTINYKMIAVEKCGKLEQAL